MNVLSGIRVLDFSRFLPAPYCSMMLGDFGADVIRIEQPNEVKKQNAMFGRDSLSAEAYAQLKSQEMLARNKRSALINLRYDAGKTAAKRMAKQCDVLIHDYRPGVMDAMGLGYDQLKALNPGLIYCAVSLCGQDGPYRDLPGHDPIALALSGALWRFGDSDVPKVPGMPVSDISAGLHAAIGILLALRARDQNGEGQLVDIAMSDCALSMMLPVIQRLLMDKREPPLTWKKGNTGVWQCMDGKYICVTDMEPGYWNAFCKSVEREDLLSITDRNQLEQELATLFRSKKRNYWFDLLRKSGSQVAPVYNLEEALQDEHALERGTVAQVNNEYGNATTQVGPAIKLEKTPGTIHRLGQVAGTDTRDVLTEFGFTETDIEVIQRLTENN